MIKLKLKLLIGCFMLLLSGRVIYAIEEPFMIVTHHQKVELLYIENPQDSILLNEGNIFSQPELSPNQEWVMYRDNSDNLYLTNLNTLQTEMILKNIADYSWDNKNNIIYSEREGGIYRWNPTLKSSEVIVKKQSSVTYERLIVQSEQKIYANKFCSETSDCNGVIEIDLVSHRVNMIAPFLHPLQTEDGLGENPILNKISPDNQKVFINFAPMSASATMDGSKLGYYDVNNNQLNFIHPNDLTLLIYSDQFDINPVNSHQLAIIKGYGRMMYEDKKLIVIDLLTNDFNEITQSARVAQTPIFSPDGSKLLFAEGEEVLHQVESSYIGTTHLYEYDLKTGTKKQLTTESYVVDCHPYYLKDGSLIFLRINNDKDYSIIHREIGGKELILARNIYRENLLYYGEYKLYKQIVVTG